MASLNGMKLDSLLLVICLSWAMAIAVIDLCSYRILNSFLAFGLMVVWPCFFLRQQEFEISKSSVAVMFSALVAGLFSIVGMGDAKLIMFFAPWLHFGSLRNSLIALILVTWFQIGVRLAYHRSFPGRIAFAPAILVAALLNMAT